MFSHCNREMLTELDLQFSYILWYSYNIAGVYPFSYCLNTSIVGLRMSDFSRLSTLIITKSNTNGRVNNIVSQVHI